MIWVDFVIIGIIALSAFISLMRGFTKEALSLVVWVAAFWVAWLFFRDLSVILEPWIALQSARLGASFLILLLLTLMIGGMVNFLVAQVVKKTGLTGTDKMIGVLFGAARGVLLVAIVVLLAGLTPLPDDEWWQQSALISHFKDLAIWLRDLLPPDIAKRFSY